MKLVSKLVDLCIVNRLNLAIGIPDMAALCLSRGILDSFFLALWHLPHLIVVQKLAPEGVEATIIAICATINNFFLLSCPELVGAFVNRTFVGVSKEDIADKYPNLVYFQLLGCLLTFPLILIVPTK